MAITTFSSDFVDTHTRESSPVAASQSLLNLPKHQLAYIESVEANSAFGAQDAMVSRRLHDLGFLPNTAIKIVAKGLFGRPPFAIQLSSGAQFSLRRDELAKIKCRLV